MRALRIVRDWAVGLLILCIAIYFMCGSYALFVVVLTDNEPPVFLAALAMACAFPCALVALASWMAIEITAIRHSEARRSLLSSDQRALEDERKRLP